MTRAITVLLIAFSLSLGNSICQVARDLPADGFLDTVSAHPAGDQVERDQASETAQSLGFASPAEVERVLPSVLQHTRTGNEAHARAYAVGFLVVIAVRPDGAELLSSKSEEIASLIVDADPAMQRVAVKMMYYVIGKIGANNQKPYLSALLAAIQKTTTPQDVDVEIILPLLRYDSSDPEALRAVLSFLNRDDLTADTRRQLPSLGAFGGFPEEIYEYLAKELDDPNPTVRAAALVAFASSTTAFHTLGKPRAERIASDPQENPQIRELAKESLAGPSGLNPNIDLPPDKSKGH